MEDWPDWFQLAPAFVAADGTDQLKQAEVASEFLEAVEEHEHVSLNRAVGSYLRALESWLGHVPRDADQREVADGDLLTCGSERLCLRPPCRLRVRPARWP